MRAFFCRTVRFSSLGGVPFTRGPSAHTPVVAPAGAPSARPSRRQGAVASVEAARATTAGAVTAVGVIASATATKKSSAAAIIGIAVGVAVVYKAVVVHWVAVAIAR